MRKTITYSTPEERETIIQENQDLILVEEHNLVTGNFLVFEDERKKPSSIEEVNDKVDLLIQMQLEKEGIL